MNALKNTLFVLVYKLIRHIKIFMRINKSKIVQVTFNSFETRKYTKKFESAHKTIKDTTILIFN